MPDNSVSLFFLGNASDKYERQNEAYDKQEQNLNKESSLWCAADSGNQRLQCGKDCKVAMKSHLYLYVKWELLTKLYGILDIT